MIKHKILIAEDDEFLRDMLAKYLRMGGFEVASAVNGEEVILKEEEIRPDLVILDVKMPGIDGFEACKIIRKKRNGVDYVPIIFLSGLITEGIVIAGLKLGADDFVKKPFEHLELITRVRNLLKMKDFIQHVELLENMIFALVKSIETRDFYTAGHSKRVSEISAKIAKKLGLSKEEIGILRKSSLLHDIGKIGISDQILNKSGKLTEQEFASVKEHPVKGEEICKNLRLQQDVLTIIRSHHEKLDGSGYPDGLRGKDIGKLVRIVTVADIYDALTTKRPYRTDKSDDEAIEILLQEAEDNKLDITIVECLK
ncbi:MAG: HD domain-containing phosphohydrolase [Elusimicrobiota bacterium]